MKTALIYTQGEQQKNSLSNFSLGTQLIRLSAVVRAERVPSRSGVH